MISKYVTAALVAAMMAGTGGAFAKSLSLKDEVLPAEFPPASFKGNQYVDSRGCVFMRAGVDGNITWVPRVSRSRTVICGFKPTLPAGQGRAIATAPATAPVQIVPADAAKVKSTSEGAVKVAPSGRGADTPRPKPRPLFAAKPKPAAQRGVTQSATQKTATKKVMQPMRTVASISTMPRPVAPAPQVIRPAPRALAAPQPAPRPVVIANAAPSCKGASAISAQYVGTSRAGLPVRCGPQKRGITARSSGATAGHAKSRVPTVRTAPEAAAIPLNSVSPNTRIIPRHVYEMRRAAGHEQIKAPKGYRAAWTDDRLNPRRAEQTVAGVQAMDLRWTKTVPRKLYDARDGRVVNKLFPALRYPYTSMAQQKKSSAIIVGRSESAASRVSTRRSAASAGHSYVQVGSFGDGGNATRTAAKITAMGLPVRMGKSNALTVVLAGPFDSTSHVQGALLAVRKAGFKDAFSR